MGDNCIKNFPKVDLSKTLVQKVNQNLVAAIKLNHTSHN